MGRLSRLVLLVFEIYYFLGPTGKLDDDKTVKRITCVSKLDCAQF